MSPADVRVSVATGPLRSPRHQHACHAGVTCTRFKAIERLPTGPRPASKDPLIPDVSLKSHSREDLSHRIRGIRRWRASMASEAPW